MSVRREAEAAEEKNQIDSQVHAWIDFQVETIHNKLIMKLEE